MDDYDQACRFQANLDPIGFFHWLLGDAVSVRFQNWLDTRTVPFPGDDNRTCDRVAHLVGPETDIVPVALNVEFQTENDPLMLERMLEYAARLRRELRHGEDGRGRLLILSALVNLTGPIQDDTLEMRLPGRPEVQLRLRVVLRTLREEDAAVTLAAITEGRVARCLLPWIPLMRNGGEDDKINLWKQLAEAEPDPVRRSDYAGLTLVYARLTDSSVKWQQNLEGWNMRRSPVVEAWREEGRMEGRMEGHTETLKDALLHTLRIRFNGEAEDLRPLIEATSDISKLQGWFDAALKAATLDQFRAELDR